MSLRSAWFLAVLFVTFSSAQADVVQVRDTASLKSALTKLSDGTVLRIAAGEYPGGHDVKSVPNLTIEAADPDKPPQFKGGRYGWHFSNCDGLKLRQLRVSGQSRNGINLDDGGSLDRPMKDVVLEHLTINDIGPKGNVDGLKCSGLDDVTIRDCSD